MGHTNTAERAPAILVRRSAERGFEDFGWADNWMTFSFAGYHDPDWVNFGPLRVMVENHIQPRAGFPAHSHRDAEILTYVVSGTLTHSDSAGNRADVTAGEMQLISAGAGGMIHAEENRQDDVEHNYQMWLVPERAGTAFAYQQLKFTPEERAGRFCLYASPGGRAGSMPVNTDARIYAGLFGAGQQVRHELEAGRGAWIQVVGGRLRMGELVLGRGDGAGVTGSDSLDLRFDEDSELLLFDMRMDTPLLWR